MMAAKKIILDKSFNGAPRDDNFKIVEEQIAELKNGGNSNIFVSWIHTHQKSQFKFSPTNTLRLKNILTGYYIIIIFFFNLEILVEAIWFSVDPYIR